MSHVEKMEQQFETFYAGELQKEGYFRGGVKAFALYNYAKGYCDGVKAAQELEKRIANVSAQFDRPEAMRTAVDRAMDDTVDKRRDES